LILAFVTASLVLGVAATVHHSLAATQNPQPSSQPDDVQQEGEYQGQFGNQSGPDIAGNETSYGLPEIEG